ncbi:carboxymethylenebutenolidase [Phyllosticta capitalensis]
MGSLTNGHGPTTGFLSFNKRPPQVHVLGDDPDFDPTMLSTLRAEGFSVHYHGLLPNRDHFINTIRAIPDALELGEHYAIIAFGQAATVALQLAMKPMPRLAALVAYYPDALPSPNYKYPTQLHMVLHVAGDQQLGGCTVKSYWYRGTTVSFAEADLDEFEPVSAGLAWSRTLGCVRRGLNINVDLESVWEEHLQYKFSSKDAEKTMTTMVPQPYLNHVPTGTGGIGRGQLMRFYRDFFHPGLPPSFNIRLISRTAGVDRVVDEMVVSFRHTQDVPWILPGVPPTNKRIDIAMVSIVCIKGGKVESEKVYWDQASVLVQAGLLNPAAVPKQMRDKGLQQLPIVEDSARKLLDEESVPSNELIEKW